MNLIRFLIVLSVFIFLNVYLYMRGRQALPDRLTIQSIYTFVFLVFSLAVFLAIFLGDRLPSWLTLVFEYAGGYYMILFVYLFTAALFGDILRLSDHFFHIFPAWISNNYDQAKLWYFGISMFSIVIVSLIGFIRFANPGIVSLEVRPESGSKHAGDLTVVAASDLHLGNVIRRDRLANWVELINSQDPDIILLAGDIFDRSYRAVIEQKMDQELLKLKATYGVYAIPGNHDYYAGLDQVLDFLEKSGIKVLRDTAVIIDDRFVIIGRDDMTNKNRKSLGMLVDSLNHGLPKIVLDHQPGSLDESVRYGVDLHISGHTHNGQIFPFNRIVSRIYDLGYGYRKTGNTHFYVSSGLGLWGAPVRLGTKSEIVKIQLDSSAN